MSKEGEQIKPQIEGIEQQKEQAANSPSSSSSSQKSQSSDSHHEGNSSVSEQEIKEQAKQGNQENQRKIVRYKYCCKICKHPDKSKRACVCVVPLSQRRADLGNGCRNCGCMGCSKQDFLSKGEDPEYHPQTNRDKTERPRKVEQKREERRYERNRERSNSRKRNRSPKYHRSPSESRSRSPEYIDSASMKFYNFDRSLIGGMIINEYQLNPILLGFAVPQRTYSYVFGRPK